MCETVVGSDQRSVEKRNLHNDTEFQLSVFRQVASKVALALNGLARLAAAGCYR